MNSQKFIPNINGDRLVKASQVKEFTLEGRNPFYVLAWISANDYIFIYKGDSFEDSQRWLAEFLARD